MASLDQPQRTSFEDRQFRMIQRRIVSSCVYQGLSSADADDLSQDIWEWLIRTNRVTDAISEAWVARVTANFVRRHWRQKLRDARLADRARLMNGSAQSGPPSAPAEARLFLDRLAKRSSRIEAALLSLMRRGQTLTEAAKALGVPPGSRQFYLLGLRSRARKLAGLRRRRKS